MDKANWLKGRVRVLLIFFMVALIVSGLTAVPLQWELGILNHLFGPGSDLGSRWSPLAEWIGRVNSGVQDGYGQYPFLAYGTDWLAFGHIVIAIAFVGPLRDPIKNVWVVELGMIACILIVPWSLLFGILRNIPLFWTLIDMSLGVLGIIPLWFVRRDVLRLAGEV